MDKLYIATANSRKATVWKNRKTTWDNIVNKCRETTRTAETVAEYKRMTKERQSEVKDVGGFVGGYLNEGKRKKGFVKFRSLATLDIDYGTPDFWEEFTLSHSFAAMIYSTHKHTPDNPRLRLVIPFSRNVTPEEYEPVCRWIAAEAGIEMFDVSTYETMRLFYWPSTSKDGDYVFEVQDGKPLDPDKVLATYHDPFNASEWARSEREDVVMRKSVEKAEDPTEKNGIVGKFCRTYTIEDAIDKFLPDIYEQTAQDGRYTYREGSVAGGLICYDHKFAFSHHETDPAGGRLLNAFDIVRVHKFGSLDEGRNADRVTALPSYERMSEFASDDSEVKKIILREIKSSAEDDFGGVSTEEDGADDDWQESLETTKNGRPQNTAKNVLLILENDPEFKGHIRFNEFANYVSTPGGLPWRREARKWRDNDNSQLRIHLELNYQITGKDKIRDAKIACADRHRYNPVMEYLDGLRWDGRKRAGRLLIDYLGAEDCKLNERVMELWLAAAVARVKYPGCKFDYCLIVSGPQGIGKSTLFEVLGGEWFNGNVSAVGLEKSTLEQLSGSWIVELQELDSFRRSEASSIKSFLSNRNDRYRGAFKEDSEDHPRMCVFVGTTNERIFLRDNTGDRRFWVVQAKGGEADNIRESIERERDQIWAEAVEMCNSMPIGVEGQPVIMLSPDERKEMAERQSGASIVTEDPIGTMLEEFLETKVPVDWSAYTMQERRLYYQNEDDIKCKGTTERTKMCPAEFVCEYMRLDLQSKEYQYKSVRVRELMEANEGWRFVGQKRYWYGTRYGKPKNVFERIENNEEDEDDI